MKQGVLKMENYQKMFEDALATPVALASLPVATFMLFFGTPLVFASLSANMLD